MITLLAELITLTFPWKVGKEEVKLPTYSKSFDLLFIPHAHVLYSNPYSITKQMATTSISCSDFENIIDSMFSKLRQSASHVFRKIRRCTLIWYGFCFGFNHVLSRFYLCERIHNPVSVSRCAFNGVLLWNWQVLNVNIKEIISLSILLCLLIHNIHLKYDQEANEIQVAMLLIFHTHPSLLSSGSFFGHCVKFICKCTLKVFLD